MAAMAATVYDGLPSLVFQPIVATVVAGVVVGLSAVFGLVFLIPPLGRLWRGHPAEARATAAMCLALKTTGSMLGITDVYTDPNTGRRFVGLHPAAALLTYLGLVFVAMNWPGGRQDD